MTELVKVGIDCEEWWPVYTIDQEFTRFVTAEVPLNLYNRFKQNLKEFYDIQTEIEKYYEQGE